MLLKKLYLNVSLITGKELQDKLTSAWYKMVKVINDWERSGAGHGMAVEDLEGEGVYKFINGDDRKNFLKERPPHVLYLWHIAQTYGILNNVQQQLKVVSRIMHPLCQAVRRGKTCLASPLRVVMLLVRISDP